MESIDTFPDDENFKRCLDLRDSIDYYIGYETEFQKKLDTLKRL